MRPLLSQALEGEFIMTRFAFGYSAPPMLAVVAAGLLGGCGDIDTFKLRPASSGEIEPLADWQGALVEFVHVNFQGQAFDASDFVKIDLVFESIAER